MGLFGNAGKKIDWGRFANVAGNGLKDIGASLNGRPGGNLDAYQEQQRQLAAMEEQKARQAQGYQSLASAFGPPQAYGADMTHDAGHGQGDPNYQALMAAQATGIDIKPYIDLWQSQQPEYQGQALGDGSFISFDKRTGQAADVRTAEDNPFYAGRQQLLQAQIEAEKAQAEQRRNNAAYQAARAKQPYAPPRVGRGGSGRSAPPPPAGFILD